MTKQIKITYVLFGLSILSVILHNAISVYFKIEEPVFFVLTFVFLLSFVISVIYSTISYIKKGEPKDLWKLGWIGVFGLLGLVGSAGLYGFLASLVFWSKGLEEDKKTRHQNISLSSVSFVSFSVQNPKK